MFPRQRRLRAGFEEAGRGRGRSCSNAPPPFPCCGADEREMARIRALSPDELDRELAEHGIDPAEARERGERLAREVARRLGQG